MQAADSQQKQSAAPGSRVANPSLAEVLDAHTVAGSLVHPEGEKLRCVACGHRCLIAEGRRGICKVRFNRGGELRVPFGYVAGLACDPIEKKPFFHVHPGSAALTFGMLGCDFHCSYCQNWVTSQALRDEAAHAPIRKMTPEQVARAGVESGARIVVSSYNEPLITLEWAVAVFREARQRGLLCGMVSNGHATPEALDFVRPWIDACKVDLKSFDDRRYRSLGGTLEAVKATIRGLHERGVWLELVTLLIPGFNDSEEELRAMTQFVAGVNRNVPWHVTAFHPDYQMVGPRATSVEDLERAARIGRESGLRYVYAGNLPGRVGGWEQTRCAQCGHALIERHGFWVQSDRLKPGGRCPQCDTILPGLFP